MQNFTRMIKRFTHKFPKMLEYIKNKNSHNKNIIVRKERYVI